MRRFTSKNHVYGNFDLIGIQRRFAASFPNKMLLRNRPAFHSKEKSKGYSVYSHSRIGSIERALGRLFFDSLRSKRFRGKFRCFSHVKVGARAKKERGGRGRGEKETFPLPLFPFFALAPTFARLNLPRTLSPHGINERFSFH